MKRDVSERGATTRVFVYGTLLKGEGNHDVLGGSVLVGGGRTLPCFALHDLGAFPGLVADGKHAVDGEVYAVGPDVLARLDKLEGHPKFYRRTPIVLEGGSVVETYLLPSNRVAGSSIIKTGSWRKHRKELKLCGSK